MKIKTVIDRSDGVGYDIILYSKVSISKPDNLSTAWLEITKNSTAGYSISAGTKVSKEEAIKLIEALKEVFELT